MISNNIILIPALNEEEGIGLTITELKSSLENLINPYFLVVDGKSSDRTAEVARSLGAEVLTQDGKGKGNAIDCAIRHIVTNIDYVILTDADHTYPADFVPEMIQILLNNPQVGMVCGNRLNSKLPYVSGGYKFFLGNKILAGLHCSINRVNLQDPLTGLRVIRWSVLKEWCPKSKGFDVEVELNHFVRHQNFKISEIDIAYRGRVGSKKLKARHGLTILKRIFQLSIS